MLKLRGSVHWPRVPQLGQAMSASGDRVGVDLVALLGLAVGDASCMWSTRKRLWQLWHSASGSVNSPTWPEATQVWRGRMIEESRPTTSSRAVTIERHHWRLMFSLSSTPSGP